MQHYTEMEPVEVKEYKTRHGSFDDNIYTFDIETTSLFKSEEWGDEWTPYFSMLRNSKRLLKHGTPYIWMFGINETCYYGRDMVEEFPEVLEKISDPDVMKIIYIHNLGWEFQFLRDIIDRKKWTISKMVARAPRKPISFVIDELNIMFRCSLRLTELSLANCCKRWNIKQAKRSGDLDYDKPRGIETPLTDTELGYCEYDIISLYKLIEIFREEYGHVRTIPLTQTGEVRFAYKHRVPQDHYFKVQNDIPTLRLFKWIQKSLMGGYVHGSILYNGILQKNCLSKDESSAYPRHLVSKKYPFHMFYHWGRPKGKILNRDEYAILYHVRFKNVQLKRVMSFISISKAEKISIPFKADNGRLVSCDSIELYLTEIDFDLFCEFYSFSEIDYIDYYAGKKKWMPKYFVEFVLDQYGAKTKLKGVKSTPERDYEAEYMKGKQQLNCLFGCALTNIINSTIEYAKGDWRCPKLTDDVITEKLEELRHSWTNLFWYIHGVYCTAYSRQTLLNTILHFDEYVIYADTDSCKLHANAPGIEDWFEKQNEDIRKELVDMCKHYGFSTDRIEPKDIKGHKHLLGAWETDGIYDELKVMKSKAYCYKEKGADKISVCISGVGKAHAHELIKTMDDFNCNTVFTEQYAGKLEHSYIDDQDVIHFRDYLGEEQESRQIHGITLNPAEYHMSGKPVDEVILQNWYRKQFEHILQDGYFL